MTEEATTPAQPPKGPSLLERMLEHATLFYALLVWLGYVNLESYYRCFGIEIWTFMGLADALLCILPVLLFFLLTSLMNVLIFSTLENKPNKLKKVLWGGKAEVVGSDEEQRAAKRHNSWRAFAFMVACILFGGWFYLMIQTSLGGGEWNGLSFDWILILTGGAFPSLVYILSFWTEWNQAKKDQARKDRARKHRFYFFGSVAFFGFWLLTAYGMKRARSVIKNGSKDYAIICTTTDTIITTDRLVYIGKISEAIFVYDRVDSMTTAIPMDQVTRFALKNRMWKSEKE